MSVAGDVGQVAGAAFTAIAAGAAWWTVRQAAKAADLASQPDLALELLPGPDRRLDVLVHNAGGGIARRVRVVLAAFGQAVEAETRAVVRPGEFFRVATTITIPPDVDADALGDQVALVVACRDMRRRQWAWNADGDRELLEVTSSAPTVRGNAMLTRFAPGTQLEALEPADWEYALGAPAIARVSRRS